jgi:transcriptional regulator
MTLYIPQHFRMEDEAAIDALIRDNAFGTLVSSGPAGLHVSHIPFVATRGPNGLRLLGHVARANDHWKALEGATQTLAIFEGPHAYISPTWYAAHPSVPTWNYAVVHAHGRATLMDEFELRDLLGTLSATYEEGRPKPWRLADQPSQYLEGMVANIVGFAVEVERVEAKFKLSQNRPAEVPRVIAALESEGEAALAGLMRTHALARGKIPA